MANDPEYMRGDVMKGGVTEGWIVLVMTAAVVLSVMGATAIGTALNPRAPGEPARRSIAGLGEPAHAVSRPTAVTVAPRRGTFTPSALSESVACVSSCGDDR